MTCYRQKSTVIFEEKNTPKMAGVGDKESGFSDFEKSCRPNWRQVWGITLQMSYVEWKVGGIKIECAEG